MTQSYLRDEMKLMSPAITDAEFDAVRSLAAQGRPIPAIVMSAIIERLEAQAAMAYPAASAAAMPRAGDEARDRLARPSRIAALPCRGGPSRPPPR